MMNGDDKLTDDIFMRQRNLECMKQAGCYYQIVFCKERNEKCSAQSIILVTDVFKVVM